MNTKRWWSVAATGFLCVLVVCDAAADDIECNTDGRQAELNACARDDFERADEALNQAWKELLGALDGQAAAAKQTRAAQRAWLAFRDAEIDAHFPLGDGEDPYVMYGSMYPMSLHGVKATLTRQRTEQLRARIQELDGL